MRCCSLRDLRPHGERRRSAPPNWRSSIAPSITCCFSRLRHPDRAERFANFGPGTPHFPLWNRHFSAMYTGQRRTTKSTRFRYLQTRRGNIMAIKLTTRSVEAAQPGPKDYDIGDVSGVRLRVQPSGAKSWVSLPRWHGKQVRVTHGTYPKIPLAYARKLHADMADKIARGIDPRGARGDAAQLAKRDSLRAVCTQYLELMERRGQQRAIGQVRANLERLVFPTDLAGRPVAEIKKGEFVKLFDLVERTRG